MQHVDCVSDVEPLSLPSWSCGPWTHDDPGFIVARLDGSDRVGRSLGRTRHIRYHATVRAAEAKLTIRLSPAAGMLSRVDLRIHDRSRPGLALTPSALDRSARAESSTAATRTGEIGRAHACT